MSQVRIAARPTRLVSLRSPIHPPHKGEGGGSHGFAASRARAGEGGEGAERRASARHRGSHGPFRRRSALRVAVISQARDAQGCSPFCPGLSPPGLSGRLELLPTNGRTAHQRTPGTEAYVPSAWSRSTTPRRRIGLVPGALPRDGDADEYGRGWRVGDKPQSIPPSPPPRRRPGAIRGKGLRGIMDPGRSLSSGALRATRGPGNRWIDRALPFSPRGRRWPRSSRMRGSPPRRPLPHSRSSSRKRGPRSFDAAAHRREWRTQRPP